MTGIRAAIDDAPIGMQPMYELLSLGAVAAMAPPTYLINKLLTTNGLATLVGAPGAGKSFVALDMVKSETCWAIAWKSRLGFKYSISIPTGPTVEIAAATLLREWDRDMSILISAPSPAR